MLHVRETSDHNQAPQIACGAGATGISSGSGFSCSSVSAAEAPAIAVRHGTPTLDRLNRAVLQLALRHRFAVQGAVWTLRRSSCRLRRRTNDRRIHESRRIRAHPRTTPYRDDPFWVCFWRHAHGQKRPTSVSQILQSSLRTHTGRDRCSASTQGMRAASISLRRNIPLAGLWQAIRFTSGRALRNPHGVYAFDQHPTTRELREKSRQ